MSSAAKDKTAVEELLNSLPNSAWEVTPEKLERWRLQNKDAPYGTKTPKSLVECPICHKLYRNQQWGSHKYFEIKIKKGGKISYIDEDHLYRCKIQGCKY